MDVHAKLNELRNLVENARSMPMSSSCVVNRTEILGLVGDLHRQLPAEMHDARRILDDKDAVIDEGHSEAKRLIEQALKDRERLFSDHEVYRVAREQAEEVVAGARAEADALRREVDDYVDEKLANFEITLTKTLAAVTRGRDRLRGRSDLDALGQDEPAPPMPS